MTWTKFFDGIYLINLPQRTQRFMDSARELDNHKIPFERVNAVKSFSGQMGVRITMRQLFEKCLSEKKERILVFEDDVKFVTTPEYYMPRVIPQLDGLHWDLLSLGPNTHKPLNHPSPTKENLLLMNACRGLHAVAYSRFGMKEVVELISTITEKDPHVDVLIEDHLQPAKTCFCTYPLICTQRNGYSDIKNENVNMEYIEERFERNTRHLQPEVKDYTKK